MRKGNGTLESLAVCLPPSGITTSRHIIRTNVYTETNVHNSKKYRVLARGWIACWVISTLRAPD